MKQKKMLKFLAWTTLTYSLSIDWIPSPKPTQMTPSRRGTV